MPEPTELTKACQAIMSHDRLTVDLARSLFTSMQNTLGVIYQYSDSAVAKRNAMSLLGEVKKALDQIASSEPGAIVKHPTPENFCLATWFIETAAESSTASYVIRGARDHHREVIQAIQACLADPKACAAVKKDSGSGSSDSESKKKSSMGWILGVAGLVILAGTGIYFYRKRAAA